MMKKGFLFSVLFVFCQMFGQSNIQLNRTIEWANYYFINENYKTAISKYASLDDKFLTMRDVILPSLMLG